jgi:mRNA interferase MazF
MEIRRGDIWWADLPEPRASDPGFRRPVLVVQDDDFNESLIGTVVIAAITTNLELAKAPGNVLVAARQSGLPKDSVINVSQLLTLDRRFLTEFVGPLPDRKMAHVNEGLRLVLSLK